MFQSLKFRRILLCLALLLTGVMGWFLHDVPWSMMHGDAGAESIHSTNGIPDGRNPLSSNITALPSVNPTILRYQTAARANLLQLTTGLRPGRGAPIPSAEDEHDLPVSDVSFYNWRGELLSGWLALAKPGAPVIIVAHGTPGNRMSVLSRSVALYKHGYNVLLFDFQSYGNSGGQFSTLGMVESEDILSAINYLHGLSGTMYSKIGVLGVSMGATAAVLAAARSNDIDALVAESCPVDATEVTADVPDSASRLADEELIEAIYGVDVTQARPIDVIQKLAGHTALFLINGDNDTITPLAGMQQLYNVAGQPKQSWIVPTAGHAASFDVDTSGYIQHVDDFFDAHLL